MAKSSFSLQKYALVGAGARLRELDQERTHILRAFPQLRSGRKVGIASRRAQSDPGEGGAPVKRRRRKMSAEARKKISDAQKKRWAKQKKAQGKGGH